MPENLVVVLQRSKTYMVPDEFYVHSAVYNGTPKDPDEFPETYNEVEDFRDALKKENWRLIRVEFSDTDEEDADDPFIECELTFIRGVAV